MYSSESITSIAKSLCLFQEKVGTIDKNKNVSFTFNGKITKYNYADQASIFHSIKPALTESKLSYSQIIVDDGAKLVTMLMHESGEWLKSEIKLMMSGDIKSYGSDITYKRRYALSAILGLATEDDADGDLAPSQSQPEETVTQKEVKSQVEKKPLLKQGTEAWARAIASYKENGNLDKVKKHMEVTIDTEELIKQQVAEAKSDSELFNV